MNTSQEDNSIDDAKLIDDIQKYGWTVMIVEATDYLPSFAYTIGLWKNYQHPELICFGLATTSLHSVLNVGGELVREGQRLETGREYDDFFEQGTSQFISVQSRNLNDYFGYALWFNKMNEFPALQLVWTDRNNRYPWNKGFEEEFIYRQPLLDRNAGFKFREEKNLAVFTTRQWLEENKPILRVIHEEDGDWQFLTGDQMPEDIKIVALEQVTLRDPTINDVFNLEYGEAAQRNFVGDKWIRSSVQREE
jgi:hypothetical protein